MNFWKVPTSPIKCLDIHSIVDTVEVVVAETNLYHFTLGDVGQVVGRILAVDGEAAPEVMAGRLLKSKFLDESQIFNLPRYFTIPTYGLIIVKVMGNVPTLISRSKESKIQL